MAYELIIAEHAEKQIDELAGYLVEELHNLEAAKHFLDELEKVLKEELNRDGVSVVIARYPCALLDKRRHPAAKVTGCRNCGACMRLGCPAIERGEGGVRINAALCNGCGLCVSMCAFGAISCGGDQA